MLRGLDTYTPRSTEDFVGVRGCSFDSSGTCNLGEQVHRDLE